MSVPRYSPELIHSLARVLAGAALDELMAEMAGAQASASEPTKSERRAPDQGETRHSGDFDDGDRTPIQSA